MRVRGYILLLLVIFSMTGCMETKTSDPEKAYKYWSGTNAPDNVQLLKGQYWQSSHWTKEYIIYLKCKTTKKWWNDFLKQNSLSEDKSNWYAPDDAPNWFKPSENSVRYVSGNEFNQDSKYFRDSITGVSYIYEIQL